MIKQYQKVLKYCLYLVLLLLTGDILTRIVFPWLLLPSAVILAALIIKDKDEVIIAKTRE